MLGQLLHVSCGHLPKWIGTLHQHGKDYRGHLYSPFLPSYTVSTKMVFWKLLQVMLAITFLKGAVHKFTLNLWRMSRYGRPGLGRLGRFNLRQPDFRCEPLPAYIATSSILLFVSLRWNETQDFLCLHNFAGVNHPKSSWWSFRQTYPLHTAAREHNWRMVELLLKFGADKNQTLGFAHSMFTTSTSNPWEFHDP